MRTPILKPGLACIILLLAWAAVAATNRPAADTNFIDPALTADNPASAQLNELMAKAKLDTNSSVLGGGSGFNMESLMDKKFLFASMFWGAVAGGYLLYARKQREIPPFLGGVAMLGISFLVTSWFWMSVACLGVAVGVYLLMKQGD